MGKSIGWAGWQARHASNLWLQELNKKVMAKAKRSTAYQFIAGFFLFSFILMLAGQTMAIFHYELNVRLALYESIEKVGAIGMQVNRAFGASDTAIYMPLMFISNVGLKLRKLVTSNCCSRFRNIALLDCSRCVYATVCTGKT